MSARQFTARLAMFFFVWNVFFGMLAIWRTSPFDIRMLVTGIVIYHFASRACRWFESRRY